MQNLIFVLGIFFAGHSRKVEWNARAARIVRRLLLAAATLALCKGGSALLAASSSGVRVLRECFHLNAALFTPVMLPVSTRRA